MKLISEDLAIANIDELTIWSDNPRVGDKYSSEKEAINVLFEVITSKNMLNLAEDILERGLAKHVLPLIVKEDGKLNVYDGNRRIACLKCIDNPSILDDIDIQSKFKKLNEINKLEKNIKISIAKNSKEAIDLITLTHSGQQAGVGLVEWESLERDKMLDKLKKALHYPYAYEVCKIMNIKRRTDFNGKPHYTDIDRIFKSDPMKKYLKISTFNEIKNKSDKIQELFSELKKYKEYKKANSYSRLFNKNEDYTTFFNFVNIKRPSVEPVEKPVTKPTIIPAFIKLRSNRSINIPSEQIDLYKEIIDARDSGGNKISDNEIIIESQDIKIVNGILHSINEVKTIKVSYKYADIITGVVVNKIELTFIKNSSPLIGKINKEYLISTGAKESYSINISPTITKLINQINSLDIENYIEVIACSIRTLFEVSVKILGNTSKYDKLLNSKDIKDKVSEIITYINNKKIISEISNNSGLGYYDLQNFLSSKNFSEVIGHAHLGAHSSTTLLSTKDIEQLGKYAGIFLVVINEMINNSNIE